jgi:hypothetical protein
MASSKFIEKIPEGKPMALTELEHKQFTRHLDAWLAKRRPPEHIRPQLDYSYTLDGQTVELVEIRPAWDNPAEILRRSFARITFVKTQAVWKLYWMRASGKWHPYEPATFGQLDKALAEVDRDRMGCFYG